MVAPLDLELEQLDVNTTFLHGELEKQIYMHQLKKFVVQGKEDFIYLLDKSLYEMKQSVIWTSIMLIILDKRSLAGYVFTFFYYVISWKVILQTKVALSATEVKYLEIKEVIKKAIWGHVN